MTSEQIEKFVETQKVEAEHAVKISFKTRNAVRGLIVKSDDYKDLKSKNFWRVVVRANIKKWQESKSVEYAKIYNGTEFTRLAVISVWDED